MKSKFRFSSSPWGFRFYTFEKYCKFLKSIGLKYICAQIEGSSTFPLQFSKNISDKEIKEVLQLVEKLGLKIIEISNGGDYSVKTGIEKEIEKSKKHIDIGAKLGVEIFRLFAGWINEKDATDNTYTQVSESLTELGKYAKKYNITIVMENHGGITGTTEQVLRILKKVKVDNVGLNYDPANFYFYGEDPLKALNKLLPYIFFTHFKNCKKVGNKLVYCRLREGIIDYKPIFEKLLPNYSGYYVLEYEEPSDVESGTKDDFKFLKKILNETKISK